MVVLITGASHTGKTALAQKLLEKYGFPYLSIDHLKMGLIRSGYTKLTPEDDEKLADYLWPVLREIIKTAIENRQNLVIEGCYIPFDWKKDFVMSGDYIKNNFAIIKEYADVIENRLHDECTVENLLADNADYLKNVQKYDADHILIDGKYEVDLAFDLDLKR